MNLRCIAIDDEPLALRQMVAYIEKTPFLELVASCPNAFEAMEIIGQESVDLLFIDINMPELSGIDMARTIDRNIMVIFTTAYSEYALEGFQVDALDYLLKPISYNDFLKAANKAVNLHRLKQSQPIAIQSENDYLFVKADYKTMKVELKNIKYIEGMKEYVRIHLIEGKPIMTLLSMKSLEEKLPSNQFMRVHRSFIINLSKVEVIERNRIVFGKDTYIPIGEQYKETFQKHVDNSII